MNLFNRRLILVGELFGTFSSEQRSCSGNVFSTVTQDLTSETERGRRYAFRPVRPGHWVRWSLGDIVGVL